MRGGKRAIAALAGGLLASGCETLSKQATALDEARHGLEVQAMTAALGAQPAPARALADRPLVEIGRYARFGSAWHRYEFARRLELGLGVARDPACAVYWYGRADETVRPFGQAYAIEPLGPGETGIWHARAAIRRLTPKPTETIAAPAAAEAASAPPASDGASRCAGLILDAPAFAQPPTPVWQ